MGCANNNNMYLSCQYSEFIKVDFVYSKQEKWCILFVNSRRKSIRLCYNVRRRQTGFAINFNREATISSVQRKARKYD
jgi:hypothetical protein